MNKALSHREQQVLHILKNCIHFNGVQNNTCKAGVNYHEQFGVGLGCFANIPCCGDENPKECPKLERPTHEQAESEADEFEARMDRMVRCMTGAKNHAKSLGLKRGNGGRGSLACPSGCGGTLSYSVASVNGHMHARCSTKGCASWME